MTEPITTAIILGLAAQKFAEGAAGKTAEKRVAIAAMKGEVYSTDKLINLEFAKPSIL